MELLSDDSKVIDLLSKLKKSDGIYPPNILAARRQQYVKQVANIGMGISMGIKNIPKGDNGTARVATVASKILETVLIAAIAIEVGAAIYFYRDKIADVFKTYTNSSNTQEIAPPSENTLSPSSELIEAPETQLVIPTIIAPSNTLLAIPSPEVAGDNNNSDVNSSVNNATPDPNETDGNHYGQTPKPERTKDSNDGGNGNNNDGSTNNNNNGNKNNP